MTLLCERGSQMSGQTLGGPTGWRSSALFVPTSQGEALSRYAESIMSGIVTDDNVDVGRRADILYFSARSIMADILDNPTSARTPVLAHYLSRTVTDMVLEDPETIRSLCGSFSKDYYTFAHSIHVCVLGVALYERLIGPDAEALRQFGLGALLHDTGKSCVPPSILNNPGELTMGEFHVIMDHPTMGADVLAFHDVRSAIAIDVALHHHEKLDGSGYPEGLVGEKVSPAARVAAIADIYDALTTDRPYRKAMGRQQAVELMADRMVPTHLDAGDFSVFAGMTRAWASPAKR